MAKISVIVPVYKVESYIHRCINSILNQSFADFEIILVDDGSPDNCGAICDEYAAKDDRIKVIHQNNSGVSVSRNVGIDAACGEYITFVDGDDYISEDFFFDAVNAIEEKNVDIYFAGHTRTSNREANRSVTISMDYHTTLQEVNEQQMIDLLVNCYVSSCWGKVISRKLLGTTRFDSSMNFGEDLKFTHEIIQKSGTMLASTKPGYYYTVEYRDGTNLTAIVNEKKCLSMVKTYRVLFDFAKNWGKNSQYQKVINERWISDYSYVEQIILYSKLSISKQYKMLCILQSDPEMKEILLENTDRKKRAYCTSPLMFLLREKAWMIKCKILNR